MKVVLVGLLAVLSIATLCFSLTLGIKRMVQVLDGESFPVHHLHIDPDGLTWHTTHTSSGQRQAVIAGLMMAALFGGVPVMFRLHGGLTFLLAVVSMVPIALLLPRNRGELRASADGLVWNRRWPLRSWTWTWTELASVRVEREGLSVETVEGRTVQIPLPEATPDELQRAGQALEATRAKPPPERQPPGEVPAALRELRQRERT